jgi:hypothetical protein
MSHLTDHANGAASLGELTPETTTQPLARTSPVLATPAAAAAAVAGAAVTAGAFAAGYAAEEAADG